MRKQKGYKNLGFGGREGRLKSNIMVRKRLTKKKKIHQGRKWQTDMGKWHKGNTDEETLTVEGKKASLRL